MSITDDATRAVIAAWERLADPADLLEWLDKRPSYVTIYASSRTMAVVKGVEKYLNGCDLPGVSMLPCPGGDVLFTFPNGILLLAPIMPDWLFRVVVRGDSSGCLPILFNYRSIADLIRASLPAEGEQE